MFNKQPTMNPKFKKIKHIKFIFKALMINIRKYYIYMCVCVSVFVLIMCNIKNYILQEPTLNIHIKFAPQTTRTNDFSFPSIYIFACINMLSVNSGWRHPDPG